MDFRITGLPAEHFSHLFALTDSELTARGAVRRIADERPVYPCRVSLTDAKPGEEVLLVNYEHHPVASPYRMRFAVWVRAGEETYDKVNEIPEQLAKRMLAVRAFDQEAMLVSCEVVDGGGLKRSIEWQLGDPRTAYLHIHYAAPGCYAAKVERA